MQKMMIKIQMIKKLIKIKIMVLMKGQLHIKKRLF